MLPFFYAYYLYPFICLGVVMRMGCYSRAGLLILLSACSYSVSASALLADVIDSPVRPPAVIYDFPSKPTPVGNLITKFVESREIAYLRSLPVTAESVAVGARAGAIGAGLAVAFDVITNNPAVVDLYNHCDSQQQNTAVCISGSLYKAAESYAAEGLNKIIYPTFSTSAINFGSVAETSLISVGSAFGLFSPHFSTGNDDTRVTLVTSGNRVADGWSIDLPDGRTETVKSQPTASSPVAVYTTRRAVNADPHNPQSLFPQVKDAAGAVTFSVQGCINASKTFSYNRRGVVAGCLSRYILAESMRYSSSQPVYDTFASNVTLSPVFPDYTEQQLPGGIEVHKFGYDYSLVNVPASSLPFYTAFHNDYADPATYFIFGSNPFLISVAAARLSNPDRSAMDERELVASGTCYVSVSFDPRSDESCFVSSSRRVLPKVKVKFQGEAYHYVISPHSQMSDVIWADAAGRIRYQSVYNSRVDVNAMKSNLIKSVNGVPFVEYSYENESFYYGTTVYLNNTVLESLIDSYMQEENETVAGKAYQYKSVVLDSYIPDTIKNDDKPVSPLFYDDLAALINAMAQDVVSSPGYQGVPYTPVTGAELMELAQSNNVTLSDLVYYQPVGISAPDTAHYPAVAGSLPVENVSAQNNVNVTVDFGPNPGISAPSLESPPDGFTVLAPLLDVMPFVKEIRLPVINAQCPVYRFSVFGENYVMDLHCDLIEQYRKIIQTVFSLVWAFVTLRVFLSA